MENIQRPASIDVLARQLAKVHALPHAVLVDCARSAVALNQPDSFAVASSLATEFAGHLIGDVVNATGVLLHTNLGRAPRAFGAERSGGFRAANVEFDLDEGRRSSRNESVSSLLRMLVGAESALVVNNNAAAVMLVASALAHGRGIAVSRGESVEIGGGFRIPEVIEQSGATLVDVGTTNKTYRSDFESATKKSDIAFIMSIHSSNFEVSGFVHRPTTAELSTLDAPLVVDIGSGLLDNTCPWLTTQGMPVPTWLNGEPAARQALADGAALVTFSGDKLLGGPQCGIIAGQKSLVDQCAKHPLMRALRPGTDILLDIQSTLLSYLSRDVIHKIPFWTMVTETEDSLYQRALEVVRIAEAGVVERVESVPGAGSAPSARISSWAVVLEGDYAELLRRNSPPIVTRSGGGRTICDLRSIAREDDAVLASAIRSIVK